MRVEVVNTKDAITTLEQALRQCRTDKTGNAGNQNVHVPTVSEGNSRVSEHCGIQEGLDVDQTAGIAELREIVLDVFSR